MLTLSLYTQIASYLTGNLNAGFNLYIHTASLTKSVCNSDDLGLGSQLSSASKPQEDAPLQGVSTDDVHRDSSG